jgi:hypothetical protein
MDINAVVSGGVAMLSIVAVVLAIVIAIAVFLCCKFCRTKKNGYSENPTTSAGTILGSNRVHIHPVEMANPSSY